MALRLCIAWLIFSLAGHMYGREIAGALLPVISGGVELLVDDYQPRLHVGEHDGNLMVIMSASVNRPIIVGPGVTIPAGTELPSGTNVIHTLVPLVILYSLLAAWPAAGVRLRLIQLLSGTGAALLVVVLTAPFVLTGHVETFLQELAVGAGVNRPEPFLLTWMIAMESGGRWVLGLAGAVLASRVAEWFVRPAMDNDGYGPVRG